MDKGCGGYQNEIPKTFCHPERSEGSREHSVYHQGSFSLRSSDELLRACLYIFYTLTPLCKVVAESEREAHRGTSDGNFIVTFRLSGRMKF